MNKCDFCRHSVNRKGVCICPHSFCVLSDAAVKEILHKIAMIQNGQKDNK